MIACPSGHMFLDGNEQGILQRVNRLTLVRGPAASIRVVAVDAASLSRPLRQFLTAGLLLATGDATRSFAAAGKGRVIAIDAAPLLVTEDSLALGIDDFARLVLHRTLCVGVII